MAIPWSIEKGGTAGFIGCSTFPNCRFTEQILNKIGVTCSVGGGEIVERRTRKGRIWYSCSRYPECEWTSWKKPLPDKPDGCDGVIIQATKDTTECVSCGLKELVELPAEESAQ